MNVDIGDNLCVRPGPDHESRGAVVARSTKTDVRFGSEADIRALIRRVRFALKSGHA
jgi:hypothetical protein